MKKVFLILSLFCFIGTYSFTSVEFNTNVQTELNKDDDRKKKKKKKCKESACSKETKSNCSDAKAKSSCSSASTKSCSSKKK